MFAIGLIAPARITTNDEDSFRRRRLSQCTPYLISVCVWWCERVDILLICTFGRRTPSFLQRERSVYIACCFIAFWQYLHKKFSESANKMRLWFVCDIWILIDRLIDWKSQLMLNKKLLSISTYFMLWVLALVSVRTQPYCRSPYQIAWQLVTRILVLISFCFRLKSQTWQTDDRTSGEYP